MHSSRMHTVHCSGHWVAGVSQHTLGRRCVSQHALGRGVYPNLHWAGGVCIPPCTGQGVHHKDALGRGCVPSMHWVGVYHTDALAGGCVSQHALGMGMSTQGVSAWGCLKGGVCPGGVDAWGVSAQCMLGYTPAPVNRITDAWENITLLQVRCER